MANEVAQTHKKSTKGFSLVKIFKYSTMYLTEVLQGSAGDPCRDWWEALDGAFQLMDIQM